MSRPLETPEAMAERLYPRLGDMGLSARGAGMLAIQEDRRLIAAALEEEAATQHSHGAYALRAFADRLRGAS